MQVRMPKIDYSRVRVDWAPNREFAHDRNAASLTPSYVEPYLIKVMQRAKAALPSSEVGLRREIDWFIAQESQHFRQHNAFNRRVREAYPGIAPFEERLRDDYVGFLGRSLKFNLAYSEGFESLGPPAALLWFERSDAFLSGADPEAVALWKWHMAEEFEHRDVCWRVFRALYGRTLWQRFVNGWLYRSYGFIYAVVHLSKFTSNVRRLMIAQDRAVMTLEELERSHANIRAVVTLAKQEMLPELVKVFSPFYNPARKKAPRGLNAYLARFEKGGDMGVDDEAAVKA